MMVLRPIENPAVGLPLLLRGGRPLIADNLTCVRCPPPVNYELGCSIFTNASGEGGRKRGRERGRESHKKEEKEEEEEDAQSEKIMRKRMTS